MLLVLAVIVVGVGLYTYRSFKASDASNDPSCVSRLFSAVDKWKVQLGHLRIPITVLQVSRWTPFDVNSINYIKLALRSGFVASMAIHD
jgi:hypothetical protein